MENTGISQVIALLRMMDEAEGEPMSHPLAPHVIQWATDYLTTGPDVHSYRKRFQEAGYPVYPGERDGFGWLTAYFSLKQGILLFG